MSDYVIKIIDDRPIIKVVDDRPVINLTAPGAQGNPGPQGPPGLQNVFVGVETPINPNLNDLWVKPSP